MRWNLCLPNDKWLGHTLTVLLQKFAEEPSDSLVMDSLSWLRLCTEPQKIRCGEWALQRIAQQDASSGLIRYWLPHLSLSWHESSLLSTVRDVLPSVAHTLRKCFRTERMHHDYKQHSSSSSFMTRMDFLPFPQAVCPMPLRDSMKGLTFAQQLVLDRLFPHSSLVSLFEETSSFEEKSSYKEHLTSLDVVCQIVTCFAQTLSQWNAREPSHIRAAQELTLVCLYLAQVFQSVSCTKNDAHSEAWDQILYLLIVVEAKCSYPRMLDACDDILLDAESMVRRTQKVARLMLPKMRREWSIRLEQSLVHSLWWIDPLLASKDSPFLLSYVSDKHVSVDFGTVALYLADLQVHLRSQTDFPRLVRHAIELDEPTRNPVVVTLGYCIAYLRLLRVCWDEEELETQDSCTLEEKEEEEDVRMKYGMDL